MSISRPIHTTAQYSSAPAIKHAGVESSRTAFTEKLTDINSFGPAGHPLTTPSTPHRKMSLQDESLDPPRSFSDSTGLRPILTNRYATVNYPSGSTNPRTVPIHPAIKYATTNNIGNGVSGGIKHPAQLPFSNTMMQPGVVYIQPPTIEESSPHMSMRNVPRCSLSLPLAISQRKGYKWPRPEHVDVAKANGLNVQSAPTTGVVGASDSSARHVRPRKSDPASLDERYAAKGYGWARPKPLRLSNDAGIPLPGVALSGSSSPSENQFAGGDHNTQAQHAAHHTAMMTAGLDAIHSRMSALDKRTDKLCSVMEKLTLAVEGLTDRLNTTSQFDRSGMMYTEQVNMAAPPPPQYSYLKQQYGMTPNPSVVAYNFVDPTSAHSPRFSETTLRGYTTPKSNLFGDGFNNPFDSQSRKQSRVSALSNGAGPEEDVAEVRELLRKRLSRGRQQSFWEPETEDEEDEEAETEEESEKKTNAEPEVKTDAVDDTHNDADVDEKSSKSGSGDEQASDLEQKIKSSIDIGTHHPNQAFNSWMGGEQSPRTRNSREAQLNLQIPPFSNPLKHTNTLQPSPPPNSDKEDASSPVSTEDIATKTVTPPVSPVDDLAEQLVLRAPSPCESMSSEYSDDEPAPVNNHVKKMPSTSSLPALPSSGIPTPSSTPGDAHFPTLPNLAGAPSLTKSKSVHSITPTMDTYIKSDLSVGSSNQPPLPQEWLTRSAIGNALKQHDDQGPSQLQSPHLNATTTEFTKFQNEHNASTEGESHIETAIPLTIRNPGSPNRIATPQRHSPSPTVGPGRSVLQQIEAIRQTPMVHPTVTALSQLVSASPSLSVRSYSSSDLSSHLPETTPPPRPAWYFFYGTLLDPSLLIELLDLKSPPMMMRARVRSYSLKYYGVQPAAVQAFDSENKFIDGAAWYVPEKRMAAWLRDHEEAEGRLVEKGAEIEFYDEVPEVSGFGRNMDVDGKQGRVVRGRIFLWKGDEQGLMDHPII